MLKTCVTCALDTRKSSFSHHNVQIGLPNHPPLLLELVFDEGRRIATVASIPDISSGDRHCGALHSVGTGSKSVVLLSRNSVSATLSKTGLPNHPPLLFELVFDEGRRIATAASIPDIHI